MNPAILVLKKKMPEPAISDSVSSIKKQLSKILIQLSMLDDSERRDVMGEIETFYRDVEEMAGEDKMEEKEMEMGEMED